MVQADSAHETTFPVAEVEPATGFLAEADYQDALEGFLASERSASEAAPGPIEKCSCRDANLVAGIDFHPLVAALHLAYAGHRPLALSPDMIWLLICQGVAFHINAHAEDLRPKFVHHPGRLTLEIQTQDTGPPNKNAPGETLGHFIRAFSDLITEHLGKGVELFRPSFSTTGPIETTAAEVVLLDASQAYFHHLLTTMVCGIPAITLEGTPADWQAIVDRVEAFADLGLGWWLTPLRPILRQFVSAAAGDVGRHFWRSIFRIDHPTEPCGPDSALGWIAVFFPYLRDHSGRPVERNSYLPDGRDLERLLGPAEGSGPPRRDGGTGRAFLHEGLLPNGLVKVPFTWKERDSSGRLLREGSRQLIAGFIGVAQDQRTLRLRPEIGWAVRETPVGEEETRPRPS